MIELSKEVLDLGVVAYDPPAMLAFYGEILSLPETGSLTIPGVGVLHRFAVGPNTIKLLVPDTQPGTPPAGGAPREAAGLRYLTLHVANLDTVLTELESAGIRFDSDVMNPAPGIRYINVADPDGNTIELVETSA
jgi:catechol 2,3-dioxygenase-like lactoylglutathione lyase family enzyme